MCVCVTGVHDQATQCPGVVCCLCEGDNLVECGQMQDREDGQRGGRGDEACETGVLDQRKQGPCSWCKNYNSKDRGGTGGDRRKTYAGESTELEVKTLPLMQTRVKNRWSIRTGYEALGRCLRNRRQPP